MSLTTRKPPPRPPSPLNFTEDNFDPEIYKEAAVAAIREQARAKRNRRILIFGKFSIALVSFLIALLLFYLVSTAIPLF